MAQQKPGSPTPFFSMGLPTPQPMTTRPLLGIDWMSSPLALKPGALLDAQGVVVRPRGLYRNAAYEATAGGLAWSPADNPVLLAGAWGSTGIQYPYLFTENYQFLISGGYSQKTWTYTTGTVTTTGNTTVTGTGTFWKTYGIQVGDTITIAGVTYTIAVVTSDTVLTTTVNVPAAAGVGYTITRLAHSQSPYMTDACQATDITKGAMLVVANFGNQLMELTPSTGACANLTAATVKQPSTGGIQAECIAYFVGRLWAGHLIDGTNGELRQFIRWSKATDLEDWSDPTAYINLLAQGSAFSGAVRRLVPMGTVLLAYLDDAIIIGSPSNTPNLPLAWQQIPSGGVGVAGPRAIANMVLPREETNLWGINIAGHFFVGPDNIYFLSASNMTIQPVGNRVVRESILKCQVPSRIQAAVDWPTRRVRFGFPRASNYIENIFDFDWETKEWSYEARRTWLLGDPFLSYYLSVTPMGTVAGGYTMCLVDATTVMTASATGAAATARGHYIESSGVLWQNIGNQVATNPDGSPMSVNIDTQDFDEGAPGIVKFWRMMRMKIAWDPLYPPAMNIVFSVSISMDMGQTWRSIGNLTIRQGETEGWINFRATGPHIRFRLASSTPVTPYSIVEMARVVTSRGVQVSTRQQHALP